MHQQLDLFEFEKQLREVRELSRNSALEAGAILIGLLREQREIVTFGDIVKRKMHIDGDQIPERLAESFSEQRKAIMDERLRLKEIAEETGEFQLKIIDRIGRPSIRGGTPEAFTLSSTEAGLIDTRAQVQMALSKFKAIANRERLTGHLSDKDCAAIVGGFELAAERLLPATLLEQSVEV